jgi:hypothetical protein
MFCYCFCYVLCKVNWLLALIEKALAATNKISIVAKKRNYPQIVFPAKAGASRERRMGEVSHHVTLLGAG